MAGEEKRKVGNPDLHKHARKFSSDYQPENYRTSAKPITDLLKKNLEGNKEIMMEGIIHVPNNQKGKGKRNTFKEGDMVIIRIAVPTKDILISAWLTKAAKGDLKAIEMVVDRVEGKPTFRIENEGAMAAADNEIQRMVVFSNGDSKPLL